MLSEIEPVYDEIFSVGRYHRVNFMLGRYCNLFRLAEIQLEYHD
ncbi:MAG: hypothetical protein V3V72_12115 [Ignavibacteriaceae bacterium]